MLSVYLGVCIWHLGLLVRVSGMACFIGPGYIVPNMCPSAQL